MLYDTYGFPLDLTELILRENGLTLDKESFDREMQKQKERARNAASVETGDWIEVNRGNQKFVGYDNLSADTRILRYREITQKKKKFFQVMLEETPFYAEMGGQVGDRGYLEDSKGNRYIIFDTKKDNNVGVHLIEKIPADVTDDFKAVVDEEARAATSANHTATHLLHEALREVLGKHVEQKGSYVSPDVLRFDFSHFQKVTTEDLRKVEHLVNAKIRRNIALEECRELPINEAKAMGAMALFGEKYGDKVRVVKYGSSIELCGGTHVARTGNIGMVRILSESSIAAGIRRIEAVSGAGVEKILDSLQETMVEVSHFFNGATNIKAAVVKALNENSELKKQVEDFMQDRVARLAEKMRETVEERNGVKYSVLLGFRAPENVKNLAFDLRKSFDGKYAFIGATVSADNKPLLTLALSDDLVKDGYNASSIVREAAKNIKGGGGGQPFFAQAGGKDASGLNSALESIIKQLDLK